jgi:hypothetical protein
MKAGYSREESFSPAGGCTPSHPLDRERIVLNKLLKPNGIAETPRWGLSPGLD